MIKINADKNKMKKIEEKHWKWFKEHYNKILRHRKIKRREVFFYKIYNKKTKKLEEKQVSNPRIVELLKYITQPNVLEILVTGKFDNDEDGDKSINYQTKQILTDYPSMFHEPIKKSVNGFLKSKRKILENLKGDDRKKTSEKFIKVINSIKTYFETNKEILDNYVYEFEDLNSKIEQIKLTDSQVRNFNIDEFIKYKGGNKNFNEVKEVLSSIFNYTTFINEKNEDSEEAEDNQEEASDYWGAYALLKELGITTCPYCNRNYIHTYISDTGKCRADIDHFYPKSLYPFLAVSLYNFIPSCHNCNSSFKNSIDTFLIPHLYPYDNEFGEDVKFKTEPIEGKDSVQYMLGNSDEFNVILDINESSIIKYRVENSNNTFKIEDLYSFHKDYVQEIIKKAMIYNRSRIDELQREFPELFSGTDEILRTIFANYLTSTELGKRPLSKFARDICREFNIKID